MNGHEEVMSVVFDVYMIDACHSLQLTNTDVSIELVKFIESLILTRVHTFNVLVETYMAVSWENCESFFSGNNLSS